MGDDIVPYMILLFKTAWAITHKREAIRACEDVFDHA